MSDVIDQNKVGVHYVSDANAHVKNFYLIQVITTAVISAFTPYGDWAWDTNLVGVSLPAGVYIFRGSSITLTSGTCILYLIDQ